jgi:hypothetical protein
MIIDTKITTETVTSLKQSCMTIKTAYRDYCLSLVASNESSLLPPLLPDILGLQSDLISVQGTIDNYDKISLDDVDRPSEDIFELTHPKNISKVTDYSSLTPARYDEIKTEVDIYFDGVRARRPIGSVPVNFSGEDKYLLDGDLATAELSSGTYADTAEFSFKEKYKGNFLNTLLKECIPCKFRLTSINGLNPLKGLLATFENDLIARYRALIAQLKALLTNNDILGDLCSLLNFLNFQCVPDLFGMLSLLNLLILKMIDVKFINLAGIFNMAISVIFAPIFLNIGALLDKYAQMILAPIDCIINSVETQMAKLNLSGQYTPDTMATIAYLKRQKDDMDGEVRTLEIRLDYLLERTDQGEFANEESSIVTITGEIVTGKKAHAALALGTQERYAEINEIRENLARLKGKDGNSGERGEISAQLIAEEKKRIGTYNPSSITSPLRDVRNTLGSSLGILKTALLKGSDMVNGTLEVIRKEIQALITGKAGSAEERFDAARDLQGLIRLISIIKVLITLAKHGNICKDNNNLNAIGDFLRNTKGTGFDKGGQSFYYGKDETGQERLIVVPDEATLELEEDSIANLDLSDLEEIKNLNSSGVLPNLGTVSSDFTARGPLGKTSVGVMSLNICGEQSVSASQDLVNIKKWLKDIG